MDYYEEFDESLEVCSLVESIKSLLDIDRSNEEMTDFEIKRVAREIGKLAEDTLYDENGEPVFGHKGIYWMIQIVLHVFPAYYQKMKLSQFN